MGAVLADIDAARRIHRRIGYELGGRRPALPVGDRSRIPGDTASARLHRTSGRPMIWWTRLTLGQPTSLTPGQKIFLSSERFPHSFSPVWVKGNLKPLGGRNVRK